MQAFWWHSIYPGSPIISANSLTVSLTVLINRKATGGYIWWLLSLSIAGEHFEQYWREENFAFEVVALTPIALKK